MRRREIGDRDALRELADPRGLQAHGAVIGLSALVGQQNELRPPVMRVDLEGDEAFLLEIVDDALDVLAIGAHVARQPGDGLWPIRRNDGAENLPARAGQAEVGHQPVTAGQDQAVEPEQVEDEITQGRASRCSFDFLHLSPCI